MSEGSAPNEETKRLYRARLLIRPDGSSLEDAAVLVQGSLILAVGEAPELARAHPDAELRGGQDVLIVPGLSNAHQHGSGLSPLLAGTADQHLEAWVVEAMAEPSVPLRVSTLVACARQLRAGITRVIHAHCCRRPGDPARMSERLDAYAEAGMPVALSVGFKSRYRFAYEEDARFLARLAPSLVREVEAQLGPLPVLDYLPSAEFFPAVRELAASLQSDRAKGLGGRALLLGPPGPHWCSADELAAMGELAQSLDLGVHVHVLESKLEAAVAQREHGGSSVEHLMEAGLLGPRSSLAHVVHVTDRDVELMAATGITAVMNPSSNLRLRNGQADAGRLRRAGIPLALGTDSMALGDRDELFAEARLLKALSAGVYPAPRALSSEDMWKALTVTGAAATTLELGPCLAPGGAADLVLLDAETVLGPCPEWLGDPAEIVFGRASSAAVRTVVVGGRELLREGELLCLDEEELRADLREAVAKGLERGDASRREAVTTLREAARVANAAWLRTVVPEA